MFGFFHPRFPLPQNWIPKIGIVSLQGIQLQTASEPFFFQSLSGYQASSFLIFASLVCILVSIGVYEVRYLDQGQACQYKTRQILQHILSTTTNCYFLLLKQSSNLQFFFILICTNVDQFQLFLFGFMVYAYCSANLVKSLTSLSSCFFHPLQLNFHQNQAKYA